MIIDKESRDFLDMLIAGKPDYARGVFTYGHICQSFGMVEDDVFRFAKNLEAKNLVEYARWDTGADLGISLTQEGVAYKEIRALEAKERWKERIIGFVSGAVLTALAWLLTWLFSK